MTLTVTDGTLTDNDTFTWTVTNTNRAPAFNQDFADRSDAEGAPVASTPVPQTPMATR